VLPFRIDIIAIILFYIVSMAISRDDQNTFIMIIGVMIICIIALCAVMNTIWMIIRQPVNNIINGITTAIHLQRLDYNFDIPDVEGLPEPTQPGNNSGNNGNGNQNQTQPEFPAEIKSYSGALYTLDEINEITMRNSTVSQTDLSISISSIGVSADLFQGEPVEDYLKQGFWVSPTESELGDGEIVFFCNRRYFGSTDGRGCWNIDKLKISDEIVLQYENTLLEYKVIGTNVFQANDPLIYEINPDEDLLKIITTHPLEGNTERYVVLARRSR
jgi:LPXTG-site transpeptidase (sortase) family protein